MLTLLSFVYSDIFWYEEKRAAPEGDGVSFWLFSLSDKESSISRDSQQVVLGLASTQVTIKPPVQEKTTIVKVPLKQRKHLKAYSNNARE